MRGRKYRMNKERNKYIKRLKLFASQNKYLKVNWKELFDEHSRTCYKTTGTPCSCPLCKRERYDRNKEKIAFINENKEDIIRLH